MLSDSYDIIIVGAGPAGCAASLYAKRHGIHALMIEKQAFPRDKVCGDAISGKSVRILDELGILPEVSALPGVIVKGVAFTSPSGAEIRIPFNESKKRPSGFVIRRHHFDQLLFNQVKNSGMDFLENVRVTDLLIEDDCVVGIRAIRQGTEKNLEIRSKIVLGCDGYNSVIARKMNLYRKDQGHSIVSLRAYYQNVHGLSDYLEVHYAKSIQPGYFWIFPVGNNMANVGMGILKQTQKDGKIDLTKCFRELTGNSAFGERFRDARLIHRPRGWMLPVASMRRKNHGAGFLLLGDAAGLVDPFSGEGIGNAMISSKHAIAVARDALNKNCFDEACLSRYDSMLWEEIGAEVHISTRLQKLGRHQFLLNFIIQKASGNKKVSGLIEKMMQNVISKKELTSPLFYMKLLFS